MQDNIQTNSAAKPKELVLFAGIGGCSLGDQEAGFDVSWLVEKDQLAASSLKHNHPNAIHYVEDVCLFLDKVEEGRQGYPSKGEVDHLQSSSPCNGFSRANTKGGKHDEENNLLSMTTVRAVNLLKPKTGMAENVTGMLDTRHIHHVINLLQGLTDMDYQIRLAVHNSCHYGVPQKRQRVIITFSRGDLRLPSSPIPTHDEQSFVTLADAIDDLHNVPCETGRVQLSDDSFTFNHVASKPRKCSKNLRLDEPVNTMTTQNTFYHPLQRHRTLSIRELARLFDLPDNKQFFGSFTAIQKQIGNSVPVKLAKAIACPIMTVHEEFRNAHSSNR